MSRESDNRAGPPASLGLLFVGVVAALFAIACDRGAAIRAAAICASGQVACGAACVDVAADPLNCGACGVPCGDAQTCEAGACRCPTGALCNGACVTAEAALCDDCTASCSKSAGAASLITSAPGDYWNTTGVVAQVTSGAVDVYVRETPAGQTWEGFGGSFNELGWTYLQSLGASDRGAAIAALYGADGARFTFGRIPIGASDYATDRYTLDETPGDTSLAAFSIERDKQVLIPFVKAAQAVKPSIRFWASPWTPPTWMKDGPFSPGNVVSPFDGGSMKDDPITLQAFAAYLVRFVRAYAEQGIHVEAISPQNEPSYTGNYPTCGWSPSTYAKFVGEFLGPAVGASGLSLKIMLGTFNGGDADPDIVATVMGDAAAAPYVDVFGFQWGMQARVLDTLSYRRPIWESEHKCGNYPWLTPFDPARAPNDDAYAVESWGLIRDWIRAGVTAYSAWNMVLDTAGLGIDTTRAWPQNALVIVDTTARKLILTPAYYVFRHVSRFVEPGAKVLQTSGGDALAFRNPDGSLVAVLYNAGPARTMTVGIAGKRLRFAAPAGGWATVVTR